MGLARLRWLGLDYQTVTFAPNAEAHAFGTSALTGRMLLVTAAPPCTHCHPNEPTSKPGRLGDRGHAHAACCLSVGPLRACQ